MTSLNEKIIFFALKNLPQTADDFNIIKRKILRQEKSSERFPSVAELLQAYHILLKKHKIQPSHQLEKILTKRAVRTLSGVSIITVLTEPFPCPGKCVYCPSEAVMPKSYLSDEPAAARALALKFDPYEQVKKRIEVLKKNGHPTEKIELIVKGGTWNSYPIAYQYWFILKCFLACNQTASGSKIFNKKNKIDSLRKSLAVAQKKNESGAHRIIGLTLETRPDFINEKNILAMREMGCTRLELGLQTTDDKILKLIKRGHDSLTAKQAIRLLKQYGFKVDFHLMPQLPGSTPKKDLAMLKTVFSDSDYCPDMIKIYPCTVIKNSELYDWFKQGKYHPYSDKALVNLLKKFKSEIVPRYVRISRLIRDIPGHHVQAGNKITNLRQVIQAEMEKAGLKCPCLRCREIGHQTEVLKNLKFKPKLFIDKYLASRGKEYFLSFEDPKRKMVLAFCRLRIDPNGLYPAFIRELHTYGQAMDIGERDKTASQHRGLGKQLIQAAEKICKQKKIKKIAVIAGVGVRDYYRRLGYELENTYLTKTL